jgi:hypothetical protein
MVAVAWFPVSIVVPVESVPVMALVVSLHWPGTMPFTSIVYSQLVIGGRVAPVRLMLPVPDTAVNTPLPGQVSVNPLVGEEPSVAITRALPAGSGGVVTGKLSVNATLNKESVGSGLEIVKVSVAVPVLSTTLGG